MEKPKTDKSTIYIRQSGWVITEDGVQRQKDGGLKGHILAEQNMERQMGTRHRVVRPLTRQAAEALKKVKGMVNRAVFLSSAIQKEAERRATGGKW